MFDWLHLQGLFITFLLVSHEELLICVWLIAPSRWFITFLLVSHEELLICVWLIAPSRFIHYFLIGESRRVANLCLIDCTFKVYSLLSYWWVTKSCWFVFDWLHLQGDSLLSYWWVTKSCWFVFDWLHLQGLFITFLLVSHEELLICVWLIAPSRWFITFLLLIQFWWNCQWHVSLNFLLLSKPT